MTKAWRKDQLGVVIGQELIDLIRTRMKDPRVGFASVTDVELTADLRHAKVFVSVMGTEEEQKQSLESLNRATGFLRHELAQRLTIRHTPELSFKLDQSIARGVHLVDLLNKVGSESRVAAPQGDAVGGASHEPSSDEGDDGD
jgi:ribosome-binding factor A